MTFLTPCSAGIPESATHSRFTARNGDRYTAKSGGTIEAKTLFGAVEVANPRWNRCPCQQCGPKTFRPAAAWLRGTTTPELLYLETKWASLIPFAKVADLLQDVLPADTNHETIRRHVQATAQRMEEDLGEECQLNLFERQQMEQEEQTRRMAQSQWASMGLRSGSAQGGCFSK